MPSDFSWTSPAVSATSSAMVGSGLDFTTGSASTTGTAPLAVSTGQQLASATATAWVHVDPAALDMSTFTERTVMSVDGPSGSAVTMSLTSVDGVPRFSASLAKASGAGTAPSVTSTSADVSTDYWYQLALTIDYQDDSMALFVSTYDPSFGDFTTTGAQTTWSANAVTPATMTGQGRPPCGSGSEAKYPQIRCGRSRRSRSGVLRARDTTVGHQYRSEDSRRRKCVCF